MATLPDVSVPFTDWIDLDAAISVPPGTAIRIYNKGTTPILIQESPTKPTVDSPDGIPLMPIGYSTNSLDVTAAGDNVWAKSLGKWEGIVTVFITR